MIQTRRQRLRVLSTALAAVACQGLTGAARIAIEYNLPYLQQHVKDIGLPRPFRDMIPLVEFSM